MAVVKAGHLSVVNLRHPGANQQWVTAHANVNPVINTSPPNALVVTPDKGALLWVVLLKKGLISMKNWKRKLEKILLSLNLNKLYQTGVYENNKSGFIIIDENLINNILQNINNDLYLSSNSIKLKTTTKSFF